MAHFGEPYSRRRRPKRLNGQAPRRSFPKFESYTPSFRGAADLGYPRSATYLPKSAEADFGAASPESITTDRGYGFRALGLTASPRNDGGGKGSGRSRLFRQLSVALQVVKASDGCLELEVYRAGWAVALLADNDLSPAVNGRHIHLPFRVLVGPGPRLLVAEVVFLAKYEQHD